MERRNIRTDIKGGMCKTFTGVGMDINVDYRKGIAYSYGGITINGVEKSITLLRCNAQRELKHEMMWDMLRFEAPIRWVYDGVKEHIRSLTS